MEETKVSLKLLIDTKANKVLFAEANKNFVDFLFHILSLPIGTVVKLLQDNTIAGCVADIYKSAGSLSSEYWLTTASRETVMNPKSAVSVPLLSLKSYESPKKSNKHHQFNNHTFNFSSPGPSFGFPPSNLCDLNTEVKHVGSNEGFVKPVVTYMIKDNLEVKPMSTISGIALLNMFGVKDVSALVEKQVNVGLSEGLKILKASLETRAVLTNVFM